MTVWNLSFFGDTLYICRYHRTPSATGCSASYYYRGFTLFSCRYPSKMLSFCVSLPVLLLTFVDVCMADEVLVLTKTKLSVVEGEAFFVPVKLMGKAEAEIQLVVRVSSHSPPLVREKN